jgi:hypothetical protein
VNCEASATSARDARLDDEAKRLKQTAQKRKLRKIQLLSCFFPKAEIMAARPQPVITAADSSRRLQLPAQNALNHTRTKPSTHRLQSQFIQP